MSIATRRSAPKSIGALAGKAPEPMPMSPEEFGRYIRNDLARGWRLAKERSISIVD
jgi:hypothetical protein